MISMPCKHFHFRIGKSSQTVRSEKFKVGEKKKTDAIEQL